MRRLSPLLFPLLLAACAPSGDPRTPEPRSSSAAAVSSAPSSEVSPPGEARESAWTVEDVVTGLDTPWDIAVTEDGRLFVTERAGRVLEISAGGEQRLVSDLAQVTEAGESGLTGIALHPEFPDEPWVYLAYSYGPSGDLKNRISRFRYDGGLSGEEILVDALPGGTIHNGGRLRFGPDGKLWILTGDAASPRLAQDPSSLAGKVLRLEEDGSIPSDNPTEGSAVFSMGHRNPQGMDWHPYAGSLFVSEHGQTANDEVNVIQEGANYGWPDIQVCGAEDPRFLPPVLCSGGQTWAPSGIAFLRGDVPADVLGHLFVAGLRGMFLRQYDVGGDGSSRVILDSSYGRLRAVTPGPDGTLYVSTSNRDGRGQVRRGDDRILKITFRPKE